MRQNSPKTLPSTACDPGRIAEFVKRIVARDLSPVDLMQRYLDRVDAVESAVQAWRLVDRERALELARKSETDAEKGIIHGPLHGIPIGVKDIIDVAGLQTRCNSKSRTNVAPATADAEVVLQLKAQGAIVLGKLHTTEFAYFDPSPACNPWNINHTPGGSSSGSGAGTGAGMVPLALGTQTIASVNRPAAYCGVSAFKPSSRSLSTIGVAPLAGSYDTVGFYGARVADAVYAFQAAAPSFLRRTGQNGSLGDNESIRVLMVDDPLLADIDGDMKSAYLRMGDAFTNAGHIVTQTKPNISFEQLREVQRSTTFYESGRINADMLQLSPGQIGDHLLEMIREGLSISDERYLNERREVDRLRDEFLDANQDVDVFLWPAAPGIAPEGFASTGDPRYIAPWTGIGGPIVTVPAGLGNKDMPLGCIISGHPGADARMCHWALRLAEAAELSPYTLRESAASAS